MLDEERAYYDAHREELLSTYRGRYVVVKGKALVGVFNTVEEALSEGARQFGVESFLVRRVEEFEKTAQIPALTLGLLRADTRRSA
jgi:hypothetical protein